MADDSDEHYQPWARNQPTASGISRPAPLPTRPTGQTARPTSAASDVGTARDVSMLSADELLARPIPMPVSQNDAPGVGKRITTVLASAARTALRTANDLNRRADLPNRVAKLDLPRRARNAAEQSQRIASIGAKNSGKALRTAVDKISDAGRKAAPRISSTVSAAGQALSEGGSRVSGGISSGIAKAGASARKLADNAPAIRQTPSAAAPLPESQLDKLLQDDAQLPATAAPASQGKAEANLPLFAAASEPASTPAVQAQSPAPTAPTAAPTAAPVAVAAQPSPSRAPDTPSPAVPPKQAAAAQAPIAQAAAAASAPVQQRTSGPAASSGRGIWDAEWKRHPATWALIGALCTGLAFMAGSRWGGGFDQSRTETVVRDYILSHPEILPQAMERLQQRQTQSAISNLRPRIERPFSGAWAGAADGDVTLTVFTDYACTFCRASAPVIDRLLREDRRLKIVFRELPVIGEESEPAARLALVAARHGVYMPMHRMLFASGNPDASARASAAARFSLTAEPAELNSAAITEELRGNIALARELGFDGTPAWVVGDQALSGAVGYDRLKAAIDAARAN